MTEAGLDELQPGSVIGGRYRVVRRVGQGGMGAVYEALHVELGRSVAVKLMLKSFTANAEFVRRFANEARAATRIGHPGIVDVLDLGTDAHGTYLAMELLEGEELEHCLRREGQLSVARAVQLVRELADAVAAAHDAGIVHRDLKPANVFLAAGRHGKTTVKVLDFGIAKLLNDDSESHTRTGAVFGTPLYMAPEQLKDSKSVDARADVYSMGAILYHALTGRPPLEAATFPELAFKISTSDPRPARELCRDVPPWLDAVLARALRKDPNDRFDSALAFCRALEAGADSVGSTVASRPPAPGSEPPPSTVAGQSEASPAGTQRSARRALWLLAATLGAASLIVVWRRWPPGPSPEAAGSAATAAVAPGFEAAAIEPASAPVPPSSAPAADAAPPAPSPARSVRAPPRPSAPAGGPPPLVPR